MNKLLDSIQNFYQERNTLGVLFQFYPPNQLILGISALKIYQATVKMLHILHLQQYLEHVVAYASENRFSKHGGPIQSQKYGGCLFLDQDATKYFNQFLHNFQDAIKPYIDKRPAKRTYMTDDGFSYPPELNIYTGRLVGENFTVYTSQRYKLTPGNFIRENPISWRLEDTPVFTILER